MRPPSPLLVLWLAVSLWLLPAARALAADPLEARATGLKALWEPGSRLEDMFAPAFLDRLPADKLRALARDLASRYGPCTGVRVREAATPYSAVLEWTFAKGYRAEGKLAIQAEEPHAITGLWIGQVLATKSSWQDFAARLQELPGTASLGVFRLDAGGDLAPLAGVSSDRPMAIGSAFKLYVLGELVAEIRAGRRHWTDVVTLGQRSLPSGLLQDWPEGSPLTLHTLAGLMVSRSDNTATDTLIALLGRDRIALRLEAMGNTHRSQNDPFLSTAEMFRLKGDPQRRAAAAFLAAKPAERVRYLDREVASIPLERLDFPHQPSRIESIEWFASAADLARAMAWLWRETGGGEAAEARRLLAINPGLAGWKEAFSYVGYKGGSEPGVLNLTYLVQTKRGNWYVVTASWNDPAAPVDEGRLFDLLGSAVPLLADQ